METQKSLKYRPLDLNSVREYVWQRPELSAVFHPTEALDVIEVGDGNLNLVFKVFAHADPNRTVVMKQALPYLRLVGDSWPLPTDRARIEAEALKIEARLVPEHTPHVYFYDPEMYLTAMQNLDPRIIMRKGLIQGIKYPNFAQHIGLFLARTLGGTSDLVLDYRTKKLEVVRFTNPELCKITEDLIFTEPFRKTERNLFHKEIEPQVLVLQADDALRVEVAQLKEKFMTHAQALVHGDLHTGSIMVDQQETYVIDPEFAFYGPMGLDIGAVVANLLLSYASHEVRTPDPENRADFRRYLTETIISLWQVFIAEFQRVAWDQVDPVGMPPAYQRDYMARVFEDTLGMAGCIMLRRVIGLAGVADIRGIENVTDRSIAASLALNIGQALIMQRRTIKSIEVLIEAVQQQRSTYRPV
jgi:5-methylthioribose kinase